MKDRMLKYVFRSLALVALLLFSTSPMLERNVLAEEGYTIKHFDVNIDVKETNTFHIEETIVCDFYEQRHGIIREIPTKNNIRRLDGSQSSNKIRISNVKVNQDYDTYHENGNYCIQIGSASRYVNGEVTYVISYDYDLGKDPLKNKDELYFNLIGTGWAVPIEDITFTIRMPKAFDASLLGFSYGPYSTVNTVDVNFSVNGTTISGTLNELHRYEGLTVRCELPEGYFVYHKTLWDYLGMALMGLPFVSLIYAYYLWDKFGRDDTIVESLQFYPPEGMNPIEMKLFYDGKVSSTDVTSLIPYLASKGYIAIYDDRPQDQSFLSKIFSNNDYHFEKVREYDGGNAQERRFMAGLFQRGNAVYYEDLYDRFYRTTDAIANAMNKRVDEVFVNRNNRYLVYVLGAISYFILLLKPTIDAGAFQMLFFAPLTVIGAAIFMGFFYYKKKIGYTILALLVGGGLLFFTIPITYFSLQYSINLIVYALGVLALLLTFFFARIMPRRPRRSVELAGQIYGFRRFLETAKKEQLEELVDQDPEYFYDILPYTYVLGISDKWMKQFESISMRQPHYYYGYYYDPYHYHHFMYSSMHSSNQQHHESSSSGGGGGGGGGFSGGGFSGGGSGGGGGHSW